MSSIAAVTAAPRQAALAATDTVTLVMTSDIHYGRSTAADGFGHEDAQLSLAVNPDYVVPVGDWVDGLESPTQYASKVDPDWGLLKARFRPAIGNHEYDYPTDYDTYFPPAQRTWGSGTDTTEDYWSWETANGWHVVSLNFNLGDSAGSAQYAWLAADLAAHRGEPTIVFDHGPRYSDGMRGDDSGEAAMWNLAMQQKADLFVSGHDHGYQRWTRLNNQKQADPAGIRQLVVGVGGYGDNSAYGLPNNSYPLREFGTVAYHGVIKLTLHVNSYDLEFLRVPSEGGGIVDAVYNQPVLNVRSVEPDTAAPTTPVGLKGEATAQDRIDLTWGASTDNVGVTGYDVYRDGIAVAQVGGQSTGYADTGVLAGSTYTYAIDAFDAAGNHSPVTAGVTVTTPPLDTTPPSIPGALTASAAGANSINLRWNASADDFGVAAYTIYRSGAAVATSVATAFTDSGLAPSTTYSYTVDAFDRAGNHSAQSLAVTATTSGRAITFVQAASMSSGSRRSTISVSLTKPVVAGDLLTGLFTQWDAAGQVRVSDNVNGAWTRAQSAAYSTGKGDIALYYVASTAASATGLVITVGAGASTYLYGTVAEYAGAAATSPLDSVVLRSASGTTVDSGPTAAAAAGELVFAALTANSNPGTVTPGTSQGIAFTMRSGYGSISDADIVSSNSGPQTARFTLANAVTWYVAIAVFKPAATTSDTVPPTTPAGLSAVASAPGTVDLAWDRSTDDVAVTGYTVYRNGVVLGTIGPSTPAYADRTANGTTTYAYAVDAFDAAGNHSSLSVAAAVTTPDWTSPSAPADLVAVAVSSTEIDLTWRGSTDNIGVAGYTVFRDASPVAMIGAPAFADSGVVAGTSHTYAVDAFDAAGNHSVMSQPVTATTFSEPDTSAPSVPTGLTARIVRAGEVELAWTASFDDVAVAGYVVYRNGSPIGTAIGSSTTYADDKAASATTYAYAVDAFDAAGNHSAQSASASITTADWVPPSTPPNVTAVADISSVSISWSPATDDVGVAGYTVYRNGAALVSMPNSSLAYSDTAVAPRTTYTYSVDAFDTAGNHSAPSAPATATTGPVGKAQFVQAATNTTGSKVRSVGLVFGPVAAGDLLVGWFAQWNSSGQVHVSDPVNGDWTRGPNTRYGGSSGDIALYYVVNARAAASGLTVTVAADNATYLAGTAADYSGVPATSKLETAAIGNGAGLSASSGATPAVAGGELVYGAVTTNNSPGTVSALAPFTLRSRYDTSAEEDVTSASPGPQGSGFSLTTTTRWYAIAAVFSLA